MNCRSGMKGQGDVTTISIDVSAPLAVLRGVVGSAELDRLTEDFRGEVSDLGLRFLQQGRSNDGNGSDLSPASIAGDYVVVIPAGKLEQVTSADLAGGGDVVNV